MQLIVTVYEATTRELRASYHEVRTKAADADACIRVYVGIDTLQSDQQEQALNAEEEAKSTEEETQDANRDTELKRKGSVLFYILLR